MDIAAVEEAASGPRYLSLSFHCPFTVLSLSFHCPFTVLSLPFHCPFTALSLSFRSPFVAARYRGYAVQGQDAGAQLASQPDRPRRLSHRARGHRAGLPPHSRDDAALSDPPTCHLFGCTRSIPFEAIARVCYTLHDRRHPQSTYQTRTILHKHGPHHHGLCLRSAPSTTSSRWPTTCTSTASSRPAGTRGWRTFRGCGTAQSQSGPAESSSR